jgi:hypothetical protein
MCWVTKVSNQTIEKWTSRYQAFAGGSCCPALDFTATKVSNMDLSWSIDRQLCGPSTDKEFLLPGSCHPWAPAVGQLEVLRQSKSTPHCCQSLRRANVGFGASISSNRTSGSAPQPAWNSVCEKDFCQPISRMTINNKCHQQGLGSLVW